MENHDHNIIGRAFEYYNNRDENLSDRMDVKPHHTLTEGWLLAEGGIYQDMQWHKSSKNSKNDLIILAIFGVLKAATFNRSFYNELNTQQDVFNAIEDRLGNLKWAIKTGLTKILSSKTPPIKETTTEKKVTTIPEALPLSTSQTPLELMRETIAKEEKQNQHLKPKNVTSKPIAKQHTKKEPKQATPPRPSLAPEVSPQAVQKDHGVNGKLVKRAEKKNYLTDHHAAMIAEIEKEKNPQKKKALCIEYSDILSADCVKLWFQNDSKIRGIQENITKRLDANTLNWDLIMYLKFFSSRIDQLKNST